MKLDHIFGATALLIAASATSALAEPATVYFPSADGKTRLVGYLFAPDTPGPHPAVVMLRGRGGPYSTNFNRECTLVAEGTPSACNASALSKRHQSWGEYWAGAGSSRCCSTVLGRARRGMALAAIPTTTLIETTSTSAPCGRWMPRAR
jgi:hypothetical protein